MNQMELSLVLKHKRIIGLPPGQARVTALLNDSRKVEPGACFIAIAGHTFDGHTALKEVIARGAGMLVVERLPEGLDVSGVCVLMVPSTFRAQAILANHFFHQPSTQLNVVAVTGTNGKTTTSNIISALLTTLGHKTGLLGTLYYKVDQTYYQAINTTPDAFRLQGLFKEMVDTGCQDAIIEASSHALALGRIWYTDVDCAIFTNISREHLDFHQSMDHYAYAKSLLFAHLGQTFKHGHPKLAILNADDAYCETMAQATGAEVVTYSLHDANATVFADHIVALPQGMAFHLHEDETSYEVILPMFGTYNVANYLAAYLCLRLFYGYSAAAILEATAAFEGVKGRMQLINKGQDFQVIVDFAHSPDALENVMAELAAHKQGRLIALMGHSGGNRDSGMRPDLGDILFKYADHVVLTADNPRHEDVRKICLEMLQDHREKPYNIIEDRQEAIRFVLGLARSRDTLLFAGKGGEPYQVIGDDYVPYDEVEFVRQVLTEIRR